MKVKVKKCKIMRITRKKSPLVRDYPINGQSLESVLTYKDLGLLTSSTEHIMEFSCRFYNC